MSRGFPRARHRHFSPDHLTFFSPRTLGALLTSHGFSVMETYRPARHVTLRHLVTYWGARYLPASLVSQLEALLRRLALSDRVIHVNIGDIIAVIGRKPS